MEIFQGKSVYGGIAIGKITVLQKDVETVKIRHIDSPQKEWERFLDAKNTAMKELTDLYQKALSEVGEENAVLFEIHKMMIEDNDYKSSIESIIFKDKLNAEWAVAKTAEDFSEMFSKMDTSYMQARASDVRDVSERLIRILTGKDEHSKSYKEPVILSADDLAPSETVQLDKSKVLAFVTEKGSKNSHTAILARTMNIPAIIGIKISPEMSGKTAIVDGFSGKVYINPDDELMEKMLKKVEEEKQKLELLKSLRGKETITKDGTKIKLFANIGGADDLGAVISNDAEGIGLFRSEFIFLEKNRLPTEEEQFLVYKEVASKLGGKQVIIRTLDIGADKNAEYLGLSREDNPALGLRAIRLCLDHPEIFKTQLRAIFRASVFGNIWVMYPMITSVNEIDRIQLIVKEAEAELKAEGTPYKIPPQGIMIETPAAAVISDILAEKVDFFSIGTNDLSQYALAIDRQNPSLDNYFDPHSPAILRLIEMTVKNAKKAGIFVGICGELGGDMELTEWFLKLGADELSVSPPMILPLKRHIREIFLK
ncbi:MAG: phosphoenolpyruvate--protein phosphotransferase [Clostridia bacterium]|nr:phosphoenolpyruvate--protein phosphotransferase [Clostridia bacterium]